MGKTAVEMIEEIWRKVETLERRFSNIEMLMKELLNKANTTKVEKQEPKQEKQEPKQEKQIEILASKQEPIQIPKSIVSASDLMEKNVSKVKIMGQIKNKEGKYVSGVNVKVYNTISNEVVKTTKTNKAGEWMSLLPIGKYRAEYYLENIINKQVEFNALPGQSLVRVAQPK